MNMDMPPTSSAGATMPSARPMPGMSSTFSSSMRVTLWFPTWTTTTPAIYLLTVLFLFSLGTLSRFLGALKSQLEKKWQDERKLSHDAGNLASLGKKPTSNNVRGHARQWSRGIRPQPVRLEEPEGEETEPLSPAALPHDAEVGKGTKQTTRPRGFWVASAPWSIKEDCISAVLEFLRAFIAYILYGAKDGIVEVVCVLTSEQDAGCNDVQRWLPFCSHWECTFGRNVVRKVHQRFGEYGRGRMPLLTLVQLDLCSLRHKHPLSGSGAVIPKISCHLSHSSSTWCVDTLASQMQDTVGPNTLHLGTVQYRKLQPKSFKHDNKSLAQDDESF
jgi:hypothetical protein